MLARSAGDDDVNLIRLVRDRQPFVGIVRIEHARYPASKLSAEFLESVNIRMAGGILPTHSSDEWLPITDKPDEIHIIVAGGPGKHSCWMPTFGGMTRPVTVPL